FRPGRSPAKGNGLASRSSPLVGPATDTNPVETQGVRADHAAVARPVNLGGVGRDLRRPPFDCGFRLDRVPGEVLLPIIPLAFPCNARALECSVPAMELYDVATAHEQPFGQRRPV